MPTKSENLTNLFSIRHSSHKGFSISWDEEKSPGLAMIACRCGEKALMNIETQQIEEIIQLAKKVNIRRDRTRNSLAEWSKIIGDLKL